MADYKFHSLNVRGLRNKVKRRQLFQWLKKYHSGKNYFIFLQETHSTIKDEKLWQSDWGSKIVFGHGTSKSCGVAILFPMKFNYDEITIHMSNNRKVCIELSNEEGSLALLNVYAPTQDNAKAHADFIASLRHDMDLCSAQLVIGGDFNLYLNPILDKDKPLNNSSQASVEMKNILSDYDFVDIWRILNPDLKRYTWCRYHPLVQSRLDYWFIPQEMIYSVDNCCIQAAIQTDHKLISLQITLNKELKRGPGLWKFNSLLLHNTEYVHQIKEIITKDYNIENKSLNWDFIKMKIREFTIMFSKQVSKKKKQEEKQLILDLNQASCAVDTNPSEDNIAHFEQLQRHLEKINQIKTDGAILRARAQWIEYGEKNTKLFLKMEERNFKAKHITKLKIGQNKYTREPKEILNLQKNFYENLYNCTERSSDFDDFFLTNLPLLNTYNVELTERPLTLEELSYVIKHIKSGKSPGSDGLLVLQVFLE